MKYSESGVNIDKGIESINRIKEIVKKTFNINVVSDIGGFGSMYSAKFNDYKEPILVSSADGVGTKLLIAEKMNMFENTGKDIVNHSINDILAVGAKPLYFLDYIGCGKVNPNTVEIIVKSMTEACLEADVSLIGGELAEMSTIYGNTHYDIVGFITGVMEKNKAITGEKINVDDFIIGLHSSGFHTNGYSLIRKIIEDKDIDLQVIQGTMEKPLYQELLKPHKSYLKNVIPLINENLVNGIAHITGGGFYDNIERILPDNIEARIYSEKWEIPELFKFFAEKGNLEISESFRVFNMGIGMILFISKENLVKAEKLLNSTKSEYSIIGKTIKNTKKVVIE